MAERRIILAGELVGLDRGHWCRDCALSSATRYVTARLLRDGTIMTSTMLICMECAGRNIEVSSPPNASHA